jgi:hypothetical protein
VAPVGTITRRQRDVAVATYRVYRVADPLGLVGR